MNKYLKFFLVLIFVVFLALSAGFLLQSKSKKKPITINGHALNISVADTEALREKGLSGKASMGENEGMLFIFPSPGKYAFWMKGMKISLDFIWIKDKKVAQITSDAKAEPNLPESNLTRYVSNEEIDSVLEVNAGWAAKNKIKVGDAVVDPVYQPR